jgi:CBS-domain-containing membrane protein
MSSAPHAVALRRRALVCFVGCGLAMLVVGGLSLLVEAPLLFPAIGASAFLVFNAPTSPLASPKHVVVGHLIGASVGLACAAAFGVAAHVPWLSTAEPWRATVSASLALALTAPAMTLTRSAHPPAGATTLIFATGLMGGPADFGAVLASAVALTTFGHAVHRLSRDPYPRWSPQL